MHLYLTLLLAIFQSPVPDLCEVDSFNLPHTYNIANSILLFLEELKNKSNFQKIKLGDYILFIVVDIDKITTNTI